jgi:autotransporter-associated beta strand protein
MKTSTSLRSAAALLALITPMLVQAGDAFLKANDQSGGCALTMGTNWTISGVPSSANNYYTSNFFLRTPASGNVTFAGASLTLQPPVLASQSSPVRSMLFKGTAGVLITINNLTNAGGVINSGSGNVAPPIFTGNAMYVVSNSTIQADQGSFIIGYPLFGSGDLTNNGNGGRFVFYTNNNSAFTGRFLVYQNTTLCFSNSVNSGPADPGTSTPGQITIRNGCTVLDTAGVLLATAHGGVTLPDGNVTINGSAPVGAATVIAGPISGAYNLILRGSGAITLSGDNSGLTGGITRYGFTAGGQLNLNSPTALGNGGVFTLTNGDAITLGNTKGTAVTLTTGSLQLWYSSFGFAGPNDLDMGSGTVYLGGNRTVAVSNNCSLTVGPVSDSVTGGSAGYSLTKQGPGTLTLNGGGSYTGATTVSAGTLALAGGGSSLSSSSITVASNATLDVSSTGGMTLPGSATISGSGTIVGAVSDNGNSIQPGGNGTAGTLTVNGDLALNGGSTLTFDLAADTTPGGGTNDLIVVTGTLNIAGSTSISLLGVPAVGTYTLFQYGTLAPGSLANLAAPLGYALNDNTAAHTIELLVTHVPVSLTWQGANGNAWDVATTANWLQGGSTVNFFTGDTVAFTDTGAGTVNLVGVISPGSTAVNSSQNYDFTGAGIGSGSLSKGGSGTLILENSNFYTGFTLISGGTLQVGNGGAASLGTGSITNDASLVFALGADAAMSQNISGTGSIGDNASSGTVTLSGSIGGSSTVTMAGSSSAHLVLSGSNSYTGQTTISGGYLHVQNTNALGSAASGTLVQSGGQVFVDANVDLTNENFTLNGSGPAGDGALHKGGAGVTTLDGTITLGSDTLLNVDGSATLNISNATGISGAAANATLTLAGSGNGNIVGPLSLGTGSLVVTGAVWSVAAGNSYTGKTLLNGGRLAIADLSSLGPTPASATPDFVTFNGGVLVVSNNQTFSGGLRGLTIATNGTLFVSQSNAVVTIAGDLNGSGTFTHWQNTLVLAGANAFAGTLNVDGGSTTASDGVTRIASPNAIANVTQISQRNNNTGYSTLQLDGSAGNISSAASLVLSGRNNTNASIENLSGNNTLSGSISMQSGGNQVIYLCDSGLLTLSGNNQYVGALTGIRSNVFGGAGNILVSGPILAPDPTNGSAVHLVKTGSGTLTLTADNTYGASTLVAEGLLKLTGSITSTNGVNVTGGTLGGTGTINDSVTVQPGGTLAPGDSIGTLTVNGDLNLGGNMTVEVNTAASPTSDRVSVSGALNNTGSGNRISVRNLGPTLSVGNSFTLFNGPLANAGSIYVSGAGAIWNNNLAVDGTISVAATTLPKPVIHSFTLAGTNLSLGGGNGYAHAQFRVLSSTDLAAPLSSWAVETTGVCDGSGNFSVSLSTTSGVAQKFYTVQLFD